MKSTTKVCDSPLAITSDGGIIINLSHSNGPADAKSLLKRALETGAPVFIGTALSAREVRFAKRWIDDSSWELAAHLWGDRGGRAKKEGTKAWPKK